MAHYPSTNHRTRTGQASDQSIKQIKMHALSTLTLALMAITEISAGHTNSPSPRHVHDIAHAHRRHHARHGSRGGIRRVKRAISPCEISSEVTTATSSKTASTSTPAVIGGNNLAVSSCTLGAWQCSGTSLQGRSILTQTFADSQGNVITDLHHST